MAVGRPLDDGVVLSMEVRRRIVAPCDCIAEMLSPVFVLLHIALGNAPRYIPVHSGVVVSMCVALAIRTMFPFAEFAFEYYRSVTTTPLCEMLMWFEASSALPVHHNCAVILLFVVLQPALLVVLTAMRMGLGGSFVGLWVGGGVCKKAKTAPPRRIS